VGIASLLAVAALAAAPAPAPAPVEAYFVQRSCERGRRSRGRASIRDVFGPGKSAEMTYRESFTGARVFAAGAIDFGGSAMNPVISRILGNLWDRMSRVGTR
jgi:hypothetical protein